MHSSIMSLVLLIEIVEAEGVSFHHSTETQASLTM